MTDYSTLQEGFRPLFCCCCSVAGGVHYMSCIIGTGVFFQILLLELHVSSAMRIALLFVKCRKFFGRLLLCKLRWQGTRMNVCTTIILVINNNILVQGSFGVFTCTVLNHWTRFCCHTVSALQNRFPVPESFLSGLCVCN